MADSDVPLSHLLDAVEKRLGRIAATISSTDAASFEEIDDVFGKISEILGIAGGIKNRFAPINRIPPETLGLAATFLSKQRDVINATAVCQQWRAALLSFPQLWRDVGGNTPLEFETYLERSKAIPIRVDLSAPQLVIWLAPHAHRLENLTVWVSSALGFERITQYLCDPIPTLHSLGIHARFPDWYILPLPPDLCEGLFRHLRTLDLHGISALNGTQTFQHVTELSMCTGSSPYNPTVSLLNTLRQFPGLVKLDILFQADWYSDLPVVEGVTLPCLQEICLSTPDPTGATGAEAIPCVLRALELPSAISLTIRSSFGPTPGVPILPIVPFDKYLPNYVELRELHIEATMHFGIVTFRSSSQAVLTYHTGRLYDFNRELRLWGSLPLYSVRRVTVFRLDPMDGDVDIWLAGILGQLEFLEVLELRGGCGNLLRLLHHQMVKGAISVRINSLIVRGEEHAKSQTLKLKGVKDKIGLQNTIVTYIPDDDVDEWLASFESQSEEDFDPGGEYFSEDSEGGEDEKEEESAKDGGNEGE